MLGQTAVVGRQVETRVNRHDAAVYRQRRMTSANATVITYLLFTRQLRLFSERELYAVARSSVVCL